MRRARTGGAFPQGRGRNLSLVRRQFGDGLRPPFSQGGKGVARARVDTAYHAVQVSTHGAFEFLSHTSTVYYFLHQSGYRYLVINLHRLASTCCANLFRHILVSGRQTIIISCGFAIEKKRVTCTRASGTTSFVSSRRKIRRIGWWWFLAWNHRVPSDPE